MSEVKRYSAGEIPDKITRKLFIFACKPSWETKYTITVSDFDYEGCSDNYILLGTKDITLEIQETDLVSAELTALDKKREKILADAELKKKFIDVRIQALLSPGDTAD